MTKLLFLPFSLLWMKVPVFWYLENFVKSLIFLTTDVTKINVLFEIDVILKKLVIG